MAAKKRWLNTVFDTCVKRIIKTYIVQFFMTYMVKLTIGQKRSKIKNTGNYGGKCERTSRAFFGLPTSTSTSLIFSYQISVFPSPFSRKPLYRRHVCFLHSLCER